MPDGNKLLRPDAIERIERLELRARHIVEGFLSGPHRSPYFGQSIEFLQHREYVSGDDLRHVDWKVWARQDRFYLKQYEEDTNLMCTLLVDGSGSMRYGSGPLNKYEYGATIAASLAYLLLKQQDAVGCVTFDETIRTTTPVRSRRNHLQTIVESLVAEQPREKTELLTIFREVAEANPRRGMMVVISDFLVDVDATLKGLKMLRRRGHDVLVFHVLDDDELDFPFEGPTRFAGLESALHVACNPRALRAGYLEAMQSFLDRMRRECASQMVDYALVRTSDPFDAVLASYLSSRLGRHHRN